jgi:ATP-dependent Clp protease ATP-binding subunit ClpA
MEAELGKDLPDQPEAVRRVAQAIRRKLALSPSMPRPLGRFLLVGPSDEARRLATSLARFLFGDEAAIRWLDMKDYAEKYQISGLVGHPGGLVCAYFEGELTEPVWRNPRTVVVLDGIERAHGDVWQFLIPMLEQGQLLDMMGRAVSFKNAIIIMTTMVGYAEGVARPDYVLRADGPRSCGDFPLGSKGALERVVRAEVLHAVDEIILLR